MSTEEEVQKIIDMQEIIDKRSFRYEQKYSAEEIRANSIKFEEPKDYDETTYLIARANDGREYWFVEYEDGWKIDHTWGSFVLVKSDPATP